LFSNTAKLTIMLIGISILLFLIEFYVYAWYHSAVDVLIRGMHENGDGGNPRVSRGYGSECCGNTASMDLAIAGFPRGWIFSTDTHRNG